MNKAADIIKTAADMTDRPKLRACACDDPQARYTVFDAEFVGTEPEHYGEVSLLTCRQCQRVWLRFQLEYEAFTASGRFYRGLISRKAAQQVTPENAVAILESLEWCIYGGSYFGHAGKRFEGSIKVLF